MDDGSPRLADGGAGEGGEWMARLRAARVGQDGGAGGSAAEGAAETALSELLRCLGELLVRFGERQLRQLPDPHDAAQDVAQETLLRVARGVPACAADCDARFLSWVFAIARHVVVDEMRSPAHRFKAPSRVDDLERLGDRHAFDAWTHRSNGVGDDQEDEAAGGYAAPAGGPLATIARAAHDALPSATAELIRLRVVAGASWPAVAAALGTSAAGAKRRFQRAQNRLRRAVLDGVAALPPRERAVALRELGGGRAAPPRV